MSKESEATTDATTTIASLSNKVGEAAVMDNRTLDAPAVSQDHFLDDDDVTPEEEAIMFEALLEYEN